MNRRKGCDLDPVLAVNDCCFGKIELVGNDLAAGIRQGAGA
jgi:hypothetical protein